METSAASIIGTESLDELAELVSLPNCKSVSFGRALTPSPWAERKLEESSSCEWSEQHSTLVFDFLSTQCPRLEMLNLHQFILAFGEVDMTREVMSQIIRIVFEKLLVGLNFLCVTDPVWLRLLAEHFRGFGGVFCLCTAIAIDRFALPKIRRWLAEFVLRNPIVSLKLVCMEDHFAKDLFTDRLEQALVQSDRLRHFYIRSRSDKISCWEVLIHVLRQNPFIEVLSAQFLGNAAGARNSLVEAIVEHPNLWNVCIHEELGDFWELVSCERIDALAVGDSSDGLLEALEKRQNPLVLRTRAKYTLKESLPLELPPSVGCSQVIDWLGVRFVCGDFLRLLRVLAERSDLEEVRLGCSEKLDPTDLCRSVARLIRSNCSLHTLELHVAIQNASFTRDLFAAITTHECLSQIRLHVHMRSSSEAHFWKTQWKFYTAYEANDSLWYILINDFLIDHLAIERHQLARWLVLNWIRSRINAELFDVEILRLVLAYGRIGRMWFDDTDYPFFKTVDYMKERGYNLTWSLCHGQRP